MLTFFLKTVINGKGYLFPRLAITKYRDPCSTLRISVTSAHCLYYLSSENDIYIHIYIYSTCIHAHIHVWIHTCVYMHTHTHAALVYSLSCGPLFATPWAVARQASMSMGFSRQESWNGLPFPSPIHKHTVETIYVITGFICELFFEYMYNSQLNFWG